jgi:hypothetical protein
LVTTDYGSPFLLYLSFNVETLKFDLKFNGDNVGQLILPEEVDVSHVEVTGNCIVNYIGFGAMGGYISYIKKMI